MKESGKKFRLNIIDILVILILIAAVVFVIVKPLGNAGDASKIEIEEVDEQDGTKIRFTVMCEDLDPILAQNAMDSLSAPPAIFGDKTVEMTRLYNSNQLLAGKVVSFEAVDGTEGKVTLLLSIEANATESQCSYSVLWQEIRIGKDYIVKTVGIELEGVIRSLEKLG